jgi:hypothetical protein
MEVRRRSGRTVDVVITDDFNRHDQMWGGDDISVARQGEAEEIDLSPLIRWKNQEILSL